MSDFAVNDIIKVTNKEHGYSTYISWFRANNELELRQHYTFGKLIPRNGIIATIRAIHPHADDTRVLIYAIQDKKSNVYLINDFGIKGVPYELGR